MSMLNKQPVSILNEAAQKKIIPEPLYRSKQVENGFVTDVTVGNKTYQSKISATKAQSKEEVASIVLQSLSEQDPKKTVTFKTICELMIKLEKYPITEKPMKLILEFGVGKEHADVVIYTELLTLFTNGYVAGDPFAAILASMWNKLMHLANGNCVLCESNLYSGSVEDIDRTLMNQVNHDSVIGVITVAQAQAIRAKIAAEALKHMAPIVEMPPLSEPKTQDITPYQSDDDESFTFDGQWEDFGEYDADFSDVQEETYFKIEVNSLQDREKLLTELNTLLKERLAESFEAEDNWSAQILMKQLDVVNNWSTTMEELNAIMHALNGNGSNQSKMNLREDRKRKRPSNKKTKKIIKKEAEKEVKSALHRRKVVPAQKRNKLPGKSIAGQASNGRRLNVASEQSLIGLMKSAFKAELKAIVAPSAVAPVRYSTIFASAKTAIAAPWKQTDANWGLTGDADTLLPLDTMMAFMFRDAARHTVTYHANETAYQYDAWMQSVSGGALSPTWEGTVISSGLGLDIAYLAPTDSASIFAHGAYLPVGVTEANRKGGVPISLGEVFKIRCFTASAAENSFLLEVYQFDGEDFKPYDSIAVPNDSVNYTTFTPTSTGYFYFKVYGIVTASPESPISLEDSTVECSLVNTGKPYFAHNMLPDLEQKLNSVKSIRILGASIMYSNTSPDLYKQGKIACYQASGNMHWTQFVERGYSSIASAQGSSRSMAAAKGLYAFLKPTGESDFEMMNPIDYDGSILCKIKFQLDKCKPFLALSAVVEGDEGKVGIFTYGTSIEFETEDTWFIVNEPKTDKRVFDQALNSVKSVQQFHENPLHLEEIWNSAKNIAGKIFDGIITYGPSVIKGAQMLSSFL